MDTQLYKLVQQNLYIGMEIKTYKKVCNTLEQKTKTGKSKQLQLVDWKRYFDWENKGYKFIITKIHKNPFPKEDNKRNSIYNTYIEKLILDLLVRKYQSSDKYNKRLNLSRDQMLLALNMVNINYSFIKYNQLKTADYIKVDTNNIKEFYDINNRNLNDAVERALKRLTNKFLINWQFVYTIVETVEDDTTIDQYGNKYKSKEIHRNATEFEREIILYIENKVAKEMGKKTKQEVYLSGHYKEFREIVIEQIQKMGLNIEYYYKSYNIVFHKDVIQELNNINNYLLDYETRENVKITLNGVVTRQLTDNVENRQQKAKEDIKGISPIGTTKIKYKYKKEELKRRTNDTYLIDMGKIIDHVINHEKEDIRNNIVVYNLQQKKNEEMQIKELLAEYIVN